MSGSYDPKAIESRWQQVWAEEKTWEVANPGQPGFDESKPKSYVLEMLPYPSGEPHVGHLKCYAVGDAIAHFRRRHGFEVIHPMGYDSFGLPAENNAIKTGESPRAATERSIGSFQRQFREWGISIDWSRELATHTPEYYRWTQWIFLQLYAKGLAYRTEAAVQWCPVDATVLANEQVVDGRCERCGTEVVQKKLEQWFFKITDYADRLLADFDRLESWPEHVITMQRNWIGRSEGAQVVFRCEEVDLDFPVFTTRPDTLFGATFFVLAPEHPELERLVAGTAAEEAVREYVNRVGRESAEERGAEDREKTGVPLGRSVVNPVNGEEIPMFVADYVLMEYGTGAIMAVPGHDSRDYEFARKFDLPVKRVIEGTDEEADGDAEGLPYPGDGPMVNSGRFDGKGNREAYEEIVEWLKSEGRGEAAVNYRLRDWLVSRQRYWGAPIPIVYCEECGAVPVPDEQLPVELPEIEDYAPQGKSPLAAAEEWVATECPNCAGPARRETDTMDTFVDSSWYFIRYLDSQQRRGGLGSLRRRPLAASRPVHRRRRARDPAPDVRALLHQGAGRPRAPRRAGAVRQPLRPGDDHPRRREDVEVEGQHGQPRRVRRALRRRHRPHLRLLHGPARARRRLVGRGGGGRQPLPLPALAPLRGGRGADDRRRRAGCRAGGRGRATCSPRPTGRSTRRPGTSSAASSSTPRSRR